MQYVKRWDYKTHKYIPYKIPCKWKISCYEMDMDKYVNCAQCGTKLHFGDTFTSLEVHTAIGFGYGVCEGCYNEEWNRRRMYRGE